MQDLPLACYYNNDMGYTNNDAEWHQLKTQGALFPIIDYFILLTKRSHHFLASYYHDNSNEGDTRWDGKRQLLATTIVIPSIQ